MKKKLFAFLLAAVMVTALLPTVAFAGDDGPAEEVTEITKVSITMGEPVVGENLPTTLNVTAEPEVSIASYEPQWMKMTVSDYKSGSDDWDAAEYMEKAQEGYVYKPIVMAQWLAGYTATDDVEVEFNGVTLENGADVAGFDVLSTQKYIYARGFVYNMSVNTNQLTKYWITINTPQIGKKLDFAPTADIDPSGSITVPTVTWQKTLKENYENPDVQDWSVVAEDEVAEEGYVYVAYLSGTLSDGYSLAEDVSVKVNDKEFSTDPYARESYSFWEGKLRMNVYFEPTAAEDETTTTAEETTTTAETAEDGTNPKTGDNSNMFLWIALMAAGAAAAGVAVANRRKFSGR